jgi:hypothetical protein
MKTALALIALTTAAFAATPPGHDLTPHSLSNYPMTYYLIIGT